MENTELKHILIAYKSTNIGLQQAHDEILRLFSVVGRSEQLCPRCKSRLIYKKVHTDGYSCNNCFHDWA